MHQIMSAALYADSAPQKVSIVLFYLSIWLIQRASVQRLINIKCKWKYTTQMKP